MSKDDFAKRYQVGQGTSGQGNFGHGEITKLTTEHTPTITVLTTYLPTHHNHHNARHFEIQFFYGCADFTEYAQKCQSMTK